MMRDELSILRQRVQALADRRNPARGATGNDARVVKVFNNGAMPSTAPAFYACHPVEVGGAEVEGGAGTLTVGSGVVPVMVIDRAPAVDDLLIARREGGRWVAERGKSGSGVCGCLPTSTVINCTFWWFTGTINSTIANTGCPPGSTGCGLYTGTDANYSTSLTYAGTGVSPYNPAASFDAYWVSPPVAISGTFGVANTGTVTVVLNLSCGGGGLPGAVVWLVLDCSNGCRTVYDHQNPGDPSATFPNLIVTSCNPFAASLTLEVAGGVTHSITFSS